MLRTNTTCRLVPEGRERWSGMININQNWLCARYGRPTAGHPMGKFLVQEMLRRPYAHVSGFHWSDARALWNREMNRRSSIGGYTEEQFWWMLTPTLERDILRVSWMDEDGNLVEPWRDRPDEELFWSSKVLRA